MPSHDGAENIYHGGNGVVTRISVLSFIDPRRSRSLIAAQQVNAVRCRAIAEVN